MVKNLKKRNGVKILYGSVNTAGISQDTIDEIKQGAVEAKQAAAQAQSTADQAVLAAANAQTSANNAQTAANNAQSSANAAQTSAKDVQTNLSTYIVNAGKTYAPIASPTFTGTPKAPTPGNSPDGQQIANVTYLLAQIKAKIDAIPNFTSPTANANGNAGLVPPCPKGTEVYLLTSTGWQKATQTQFYIGGNPAQDGVLTYNGKAQTPTWINCDVNKVSISGTTSASDAGTYSAIFTPRGNYCWEDGSQTAREFFWTIKPQTYAKPTAAVTAFTYNTSEQTLAVTNYDSGVMNQTGTVKATAKGSYNVTYSLKNKKNYSWDDGTTADVVISWAINVKTYAKPTASVTTFTYDKQSHTLNVANVVDAVMSQTGTVTSTVAGNFTAKYVLKDKTNTAWADNTTTDVTISWNVAVRKITKPTAPTTSYTYTGNLITLTVNNIDTNYMTESGTRSSTNAATGLTVKYTLNDKTNTAWADNTTTDVTLTWNITRAKLTAAQGTFSQTGTLTYNTSAQSPTIKNYNSDTMVLGSQTSMTNAGTYTATITPDNNHAWSDGTFAAKTCSWTIAKVGNYLPREGLEGEATVYTPFIYTYTNAYNSSAVKVVCDEKVNIEYAVHYNTAELYVDKFFDTVPGYKATITVSQPETANCYSDTVTLSVTTARFKPELECTGFPSSFTYGSSRKYSASFKMTNVNLASSNCSADVTERPAIMDKDDVGDVIIDSWSRGTGKDEYGNTTYKLYRAYNNFTFHFNPEKITGYIQFWIQKDNNFEETTWAQMIYA